MYKAIAVEIAKRIDVAMKPDRALQHWATVFTQVKKMDIKCYCIQFNIYKSIQPKDST